MSIYFAINVSKQSANGEATARGTAVNIICWGHNSRGGFSVGSTLASTEDLDKQINQMIEELNIVRERAKGILEHG